MLQYIDFFSTYTQRSAVAAVASCCKRVTVESFDAVKEIFPTLRSLLLYPEPKLVEQAITAIIRSLDCYKTKADLLEKLLDHDSIKAINALLISGAGPQSLPANIFTDLLKALTNCARASPTVTLACIEADVCSSLYFVLTGVLPPTISKEQGGVSAPPPSETVVLQNIDQRPKDQIEEALLLLSELLPPLPRGRSGI